MDGGEKAVIITGREIQNLPIVGRSAVGLMRILPGVVCTGKGFPGETVEFNKGVGQYHVAGGRREVGIAVLPDGADVIDPGCDCGAAVTRLLRKIYEADPLTCPRCGSQMQLLALIEEWTVIQNNFQHLILWEQSPRSPTPLRLLPHKLGAFLATLCPRQAQQLKAPTDSVFWHDVPVYRG